jgi:hypothetical protein
MLRSQLLSGWIAFLLLAASFPASNSQAGGALLRTEPARLEIRAGQVETIQILLVNAQAVYGIDLQAAFNPAVVEVVDADAAETGVQMKAGVFPKPDFTVRNTANNTSGTLRYVVTQVNPTPPASGNGFVLSIQFRGKLQGSSSKLTFTSAVIADRRGVKQAITTEGADLVVLPPQSPTASPLPSPTHRPTEPIRLAATVTNISSQPTFQTSESAAQMNRVNQSEVTLRFVPPTLVLISDAQGTIDVLVENVQAFYGIEFRLTYDPNIAEVIDADPDKQGVQITLADWWKDGFVAVNQVDSGSGQIDFAATRLRPALPANGNQVVATITFAGRKTGSSALQIVSAILSTQAAEAIPYTKQDGKIIVNASEMSTEANASSRADGLSPGWLALGGAGILVLSATLGVFFYALRRKKKNNR